MDEFEEETGLVWQSHRQRDPEKHNRHVAVLIARLDDLQAQSRPKAGEDSANGKDQAAYDALRFAGMLVEALAGWAIDHQVGLAQKGLGYIPLYTQEIRELPEYNAAKLAVDSHEHERAGAKLRANAWKGMSDSARRIALINLLSGNSGAFPDPLCQELEGALGALSYGEIQPLLKKGGAGRKVGLRGLLLQLRAIAFVNFRSASKLMSAGDAYSEVADAYGISVDTLRSWEKRLRDEFGQARVAATRRFARNAASWIAAVRKERGKALAKLEDNKQYGNEALKKAGREYQRLNLGA